MDKTGDISFLDNTVRIDEEAFTVLKNVLLDKTYDKDARKKSASIFGELGDIRAIELLKQVIDEEKSVVTIIAGCALYKLGSMDGLSYLIRLLDDDDNKIREKAAFYAGFSNIKPLSGKLVEMLNCLDQDLQRAAASGLRYLGGIEAEDAFIRILAKPIDSLVGWIEEAFISWNCKRAIPALKKAYDLATDQRQKICFANILANLGEEKLLESMLKNKDEKIVLQIAFYLSKVSNDKGFKILLASTTNSDKYIRQDAAEAFGYIHNKTAFDKLIDLLSDKDHVVRYKAALSLGRMKNKEAIPYLIRSLNDPEQLVSSNSARALGSIGDQSVLDLLLTRTDGRYISSWLTCGIIDAFLELKNSESFPFLIHCLDNRDEGVRREAANALMKLNVKSAIPSLIRKLTDPDAETRCFVAEALAVIKKSSIQKYTEKLTNNNLSIDGEPDLKIKNSPWWKFW
jgi:HEAT repeat protein